MSNIDAIVKALYDKPAEEGLKILCGLFPGTMVFTTSFGIEDQVITDLIVKNKLPVRIVSLDTGRLFEETYKVANRTLEKYGLPIEFFFPEASDVEQLMREKGPFSFYSSVENRKECCRIRKVAPLNRALSGMGCWVTGIRAQQSEGRTDLSSVEWDETHKMVKYHPLFSWSLEEVRQYVLENNVPYNILHDKGFVSIGCEPCTRAVHENEDFRAGRWWWENNTGKECGLHEHHIASKKPSDH